MFHGWCRYVIERSRDRKSREYRDTSGARCDAPPPPPPPSHAKIHFIDLFVLASRRARLAEARDGASTQMSRERAAPRTFIIDFELRPRDRSFPFRWLVIIRWQFRVESHKGEKKNPPRDPARENYTTRIQIYSRKRFRSRSLRLSLFREFSMTLWLKYLNFYQREVESKQFIGDYRDSTGG